VSTNIEPDIARVAAAIAEPARAAMLVALLGGEPLAATVLARRAGVAPSTASEHLTRLVEDGLIARRSVGRHRYHTLAGDDVAEALEALARIAPSAMAAAAAGPSEQRALRFARTCYDHLAGALGVLLTDTLIARGFIGAKAFDVTAAGEGWLDGLEIDVAGLRAKRRSFVRPCLDWSERRDHLAGAVGAAIARTALERRWLVRMDGTRALRLTLRGREGLYRALGVEIGTAAEGGLGLGLRRGLRFAVPAGSRTSERTRAPRISAG